MPMSVSEPRYQRIQKHIERLIAQRKVREGERIPSEREIARQFGVSQMTVNRAIQDLVRAGVLVRRVGSGTYVQRRKTRAPLNRSHHYSDGATLRRASGGRYLPALALPCISRPGCD